MPVVVAVAGAGGLRADVVRNDDHLGMRLVVDYLVAAGHTAIAHLGGLGGAVAQERVAGYCAAMAHQGSSPRSWSSSPTSPKTRATAAPPDCCGVDGRSRPSPP